MFDTPASRFCLRDLPLPAKVVITCFLFAVGLGYSSALVQLHFQDSKSGEAMPTMDDVVLKFTGRKRATGEEKSVSTFVRLITAPEEGMAFSGLGTMSPAFFAKCPDFAQVSRIGDQQREQLRAERTGERDVLVLWAGAEAEARKKAYQDDHFGVTADKMPKMVTPTFKSAPDAVKVKSIIDARCVRCHNETSKVKDAAGATIYPLDTYAGIEKYLEVKKSDTIRGWTRVCDPMSLEKLTQSTHAHLLSFAVLFSLTGLVFAFTSYRTSIRCIVAPLALVAIITDVAFWWLARLSENYGMYFAMGVVGTGGLAGLGLGTQIVLSLWNMYGPKGKIVIVLLFVLGGATAGLVMMQVIMPGLKDKQTPTHPVVANGGPRAPVVGLSRLEQVLQFVKGPDGKELAVLEMPFKVEPDKNMVRAFFDQDKGEFAEAKKAKDKAAMDELMPQRHGERLALLAWSKLPDAERKKTFESEVKKTFETDGFNLPPDIAKQISPEYVKNGKLKVASLVEHRCVQCHGNDEKAQFDNYETFKQFLDPLK